MEVDYLQMAKEYLAQADKPGVFGRTSDSLERAQIAATIALVDEMQRTCCLAVHDRITSVEHSDAR